MTESKIIGKRLDTKTVKRKKAAPAAYASLYPLLIKVCRYHGYALSIHGSMTKDFDLIAIPWIPEPSIPTVLIKAVCKKLDGYYFQNQNPTVRPHGRKVWTILLNGYSHLYLDFGIMHLHRSKPTQEPDKK